MSVLTKNTVIPQSENTLSARARQDINWVLLLAGIGGWAMVWWLAGYSTKSQWLFHISTVSYLVAYCGFNFASPGYPRWARLALGIQLLSFWGVLFSSPDSVSFILLVILAGQLPFIVEKRPSLLLITGANLVGFGVLYWHWQTWFLDRPINYLLFFSFQLFALASSRIAVSETRQRQALEMKQAELLSTRALLEQSVQQAERLRISRDLHDICGHQLTALALNLEFATQVPPAQAQDKITASRQLAGELLEQIRRVVRDIRQSNIDLPAALNRLQEALPGAKVDIHYPDRWPQLSEEQTAQLLCICQEGISNALRYGLGRQVSLIFTHSSSSLTLTITNPTASSRKRRDGNGIDNLKLRAAQLGAQLDIQPSSQQWQLMLTLTLPEAQL